jgi:transcriptional regulator with XRE-family HTH domain
MSDLREILKTEFQESEYRYGYAESFLNTKLATQIKTLREQRDYTQEEAAALMGIKQPGYRRFEDVNHGVWKTDSLWNIARAYGVRLDISFATFGSLLDEKERFNKEALKVPAFEEDAAFKEGASKEPEPEATFAQAGTERGSATSAGSLQRFATAKVGDDLSWLGNSFDVANRVTGYTWEPLSTTRMPLSELAGAVKNPTSQALPANPKPDRCEGIHLLPPSGALAQEQSSIDIKRERGTPKWTKKKAS